jgi:hypothetical protein
MRSDNLDGADNQQERLIATGWVVGFVDGKDASPSDSSDTTRPA